MMTSADYNEIGLIKAEVKQFILKKLFLDTLLSKTLNKIFQTNPRKEITQFYLGNALQLIFRNFVAQQQKV